MGLIIKLLITLSLIFVFLPYFLFVYEKFSEGEKIDVKDVLIAGAKEFLSYMYIFASWVFGFIPIENYISRRKGAITTPTFIIPGWLHTKAVIFPLFLMLRGRGVENIFSFSAQPFTGSVEEIAEMCVSKIKKILDILADEKKEIFLIGHSLGGLVAKYITENQDNFGLKVKKCITICTPHKGTKLAYFAFGKSAKQMLPNSEFIRKYSDVSDKNTYFCMVAEEDQLNIPFDTSYISGVEKIVYRRSGHFSPLFSPSVADDIFTVLLRTEKEKDKKLN